MQRQAAAFPPDDRERSDPRRFRSTPDRPRSPPSRPPADGTRTYVSISPHPRRRPVGRPGATGASPSRSRSRAKNCSILSHYPVRGSLSLAGRPKSMLNVSVYSVAAGFGMASYRYRPFAPDQAPFAEFQAPAGSRLDDYRLSIVEEHGAASYTAGELVNLFLPRTPRGVRLVRVRVPAA